MGLPRTVAEVIDEHVTLELECIDRMHLNAYVPRLQYERGVVSFFRFHRGRAFASSALMAPMSRAFGRSINTFVGRAGVPMVPFSKGQRNFGTPFGKKGKRPSIGLRHYITRGEPG